MQDLEKNQEYCLPISSGRKLIVSASESFSGISINILDINGEPVPLADVVDCPGEGIKVLNHDDVWNDDYAFETLVREKELALYEREENKWKESISKGKE